MTETEKKLLEKLNDVLCLHDKMKGAYFFTPPRVASMRRRYEENNSLETEFSYKGDDYLVSQVTNCSCKNVYYSVSYYKNGTLISADIRLIKKIVSELEAA